MKISTPVAYADRRDVVLSNVKAGPVTRGRENILYAEVRDLDGELLMAATLGDILVAASERGYNFVTAPNKAVTLPVGDWMNIQSATNEGISNDYDGLDYPISAEKNPAAVAIMTSVRSLKKQLETA